VASAAPEGPVLATFAYRNPDGSPEPVFVTRLEDLDRYGVSIPYAELEALTGKDGPSEIHAVLERQEDRLQMRLNSTCPEAQDLPPVYQRWSRRRPDVYLAWQQAPATCDSADTYQLCRSRADTRGRRQVHARYTYLARAGFSRATVLLAESAYSDRAVFPGAGVLTRSEM
jgi:hypothetical protein